LQQVMSPVALTSTVSLPLPVAKYRSTLSSNRYMNSKASSPNRYTQLLGVPNHTWTQVKFGVLLPGL